MGFRIVISGQTQCELFNQVCLVADHLAQNLPNFCYERIEKSVLEWKEWLRKINRLKKWHHNVCPLVWKELLMKGSKSYYIGGASEFLEYCHAYYQLDSFLANEKFQGIVKSFSQFQIKLKNENIFLEQHKDRPMLDKHTSKNNVVVCISGSGVPVAMQLISGLFDMTVGEKSISKIYISDVKCPKDFLDFVERECNYVHTNKPGKVVKVVEKLGIALTNTDLLIILNHIPFNSDLAIGDWLAANKKMMYKLALLINASASRKMCILFPNLGPACYNATVLMSFITNVNKHNVVVATSDIGLDVAVAAAEVAEVPMRNMFCSPVWGFVGINHLVDIATTFHKYNYFEPFIRYTKVKNSTLSIGRLTPEMRTMEYLMIFDETLWTKVVERKSIISENQMHLNKAQAMLDVIHLWFLENDENNVVNLGISCDGSFGLTFNGAFSQPSRLVDGIWVPASDFLMPRDSQMQLLYMEKMAHFTMGLKEGDLPKIIPYYPCYCKPKFYKKKQVW